MEISTNRFLLREFHHEDLSEFEAYHNDPHYLEFYGPEENKPGHARELVMLFQAWASETPRQNYQFAITQRQSPRTIIGCCGLRRANSEPETAELGIEIAPVYWGRYGYAIEVIRSLVDFGFERLELRMIYGRTIDANFRIGRLVSAFGAKAVVRSSPDWMSAKGWRQIEYQIPRELWDDSRLTLHSSGP